MVQYYYYINIDKRIIVCANCGLKLCEHSWLGNNEVVIPIKQLVKTEWQGDRVIQLGDCVDGMAASTELRSDAATLNRLPVDYILRCYDRIINPSSQILKKVSCVQNLPIRFIEQRPSRLNWYDISMYHNIDPDFIRRFASRIYWENIGSTNRNTFYALCLCKKPLEEVQPFVKYDSRYIRQHISDWLIDEYFSNDINSPLANYKRRINVYNAIFIEKLLQEMYEKDTTVNFELFCEKHIDLFFTLPTGCIKQLLKAYDFSKAFIFGHMESFKSKKCGKAAKESLNIK